MNEEPQASSSALDLDREQADHDSEGRQLPSAHHRQSRSTSTRILSAILVILLLATAGAAYYAVSLFSKTRVPETVAEQSIHDLKVKLDENPQDTSLYLGLASQYYALAEYGKAQRVLNDLLAQNPEGLPLAQALYGLARIDEMQGKSDEALDGYLESLEVTETADARYALGSLYLELAEYDDAVENLERCLELQPGDAGSLKQLARALEANGDEEGALLRWEEVQSYLPDDEDAAAAIMRLKGQ